MTQRGSTPVPMQMWEVSAESRVHVFGGVRPVPLCRREGLSSVQVQMWQGCVQSRCRCGRGEPSPGADVGCRYHNELAKGLKEASQVLCSQRDHFTLFVHTIFVHDADVVDAGVLVTHCDGH